MMRRQRLACLLLRVLVQAAQWQQKAPQRHMLRKMCLLVMVLTPR